MVRYLKLLFSMLLFITIYNAPIFGATNTIKLNSWILSSSNPNSAIYEINVNKTIHGAIFHLVTTTKRAYPKFDSVIVYFEGKNETVSTIKINHEEENDLNAILDFIYLPNNTERNFNYGIYISKIKIILIGGINSKPLLQTKTSYVEVIVKEYSGLYASDVKLPFVEGIFSKTKGKAYVAEMQNKPGFQASIFAHVAHCLGLQHDSSKAFITYRKRFKAISSGMADIYFNFYLAGVGNGIGITSAISDVSGAWKNEIKVGIKENPLAKEERWIRGPEILVRISKGYGKDTEEIMEMTQNAIEDIKDSIEEELERSGKKFRKVKRVKITRRFLKAVGKNVLKEIGPEALITAATMVIDFYKEIGVDNIIANGGNASFKDLFLEKDKIYELDILFDAAADAVCVGVEGGATSYVDFWSPPKHYIKTNKNEVEFTDRGIVIYDMLISYRPKPLKGKPLIVKIPEPENRSIITEGSNLKFKATVNGGFAPYKFEWYDFLQNKSPVKIGNKQEIIAKLIAGKHIILVKAIDYLGQEISNLVEVEVLPKKPTLKAKFERDSILLSWQPYDKKFIEEYDLFFVLNNRQILFKSTKENSLLFPKFSYLADQNICFFVRLKTNTGVKIDSDKLCIKMPIHLTLKTISVNDAILLWNPKETLSKDIVVEIKEEFGKWKKTENIEVDAETIKIKGLKENTLYYVRVRDKYKNYSNVISFKTKKNMPPKLKILEINELIVKPFNKNFKKIRLIFRPLVKNEFYISTDPAFNSQDAEVPKMKVAKLEIKDDYGIDKIEIDFEGNNKFTKLEKIMTYEYIPKMHHIKLKVTDVHNAVTEILVPIKIKSAPLPPKIRVSGDKLQNLLYGKIKLSAQTKDIDKEINEVRFYGIVKKDAISSKKELIGIDKSSVGGFSIQWNPAKFFEKHKDFCQYKTIKNKRVCYLAIHFLADAIDSDFLITSSKEEEMASAEILEPLADLTIIAEIQKIYRDEELDTLDAEKKAAQAKNIQKQALEEEEEIIADIDENLNYRFIATIQNKGLKEIENYSIDYSFIVEKPIPCPLWYLQALGCSAKMPKGLEVKTQKLQSKKGLACPKERVFSDSYNCMPLPQCFCSFVIYSGTAKGDILKPKDKIQVYATLPKEKLLSFAEESAFGKKIKISFIVDEKDKILEENEYNNSISKIIWIESKIKPSLPKGLDAHSIFYGFGRFAEWLDFILTPNNEKKFEKALKHAGRRLSEAKSLITKGDLQKASQLIKEYSKNIEEANLLLEKLSPEEKEKKAKALLKTSASLSILLKELYNKNLSKEISKALNVSSSLQKKAIKLIAKDEPNLAKILMQLEVIPKMFTDLEIVDAFIPKTTFLENEDVEISFAVINNGKEDALFRIILYANGITEKEISNQKLAPKEVKNYEMKWKVKKDTSEITIAVETENDQNIENNAITFNIKVATPQCYTDKDCDDANACTKDICSNKGMIDAKCSHIIIRECINNDGCCPPNCNATNDNDCNAICGNNVCEKPYEDSNNCCIDCGCDANYKCVNNKCVLKAFCGNNICEAAAGENKCTCSVDCGKCEGSCGTCKEFTCINNICTCITKEFCCGNNICEAAAGENKCTCSVDCGLCSGSCKAEPCWEWQCVNNKCECELKENCCGNKICEVGEFTLNCEELTFETTCQDCCIIYPIRQDFYPADAECECPPGTIKTIVNQETGEFVCECPPPQ